MPAVVEHPLVPQGEVEMVQSAAAMEECLAALRAAGRFAFDTEFIGEETYYARFCVVQVATAERIWLIDPLAEGVELNRFWELIAAPGSTGTGTEVPVPQGEMVEEGGNEGGVEIIVHAGLQDLEPVQRVTGRAVGRVFDTQIAAGFVGMPYPMSLGKLCMAMLGADLGGSSKFSQWDRRPLTDRQKVYAANDVRYLLWLADEVKRGLAERGHTEKAWVECAIFKDASAYRVDPLRMKLKAKGAGGLRRREQAVANALLLWRAGEAERRDLPMRTVLDDVTLVELARQPVEDEAAVRKFKGIPWPVKEQCAAAIVEATAAALAGPLPRRSRYKPLSDAAQAKLDEAAAAAQAACEAADIAPSLAFTKRELTSLVRAWSKGKVARDTRLTTGWRREVLGAALGELVGVATEEA